MRFLIFSSSQTNIFSKMIASSPVDVAHVCMYADTFIVSAGPVDLFISDRSLSVKNCTRTGLRLLLAGIARMFTAGLADKMFYLLRGKDLNLAATSETQLPDGWGTDAVMVPMAQYAARWAEIAALEVEVVHLSSGGLWHVDVRWMALRDCILYYLRAAAAAGTASMEVARVCMHVEDSPEEVTLYTGATAAVWEWRKSRLRRFLLAGMSMSGYPDNVYAATLDEVAVHVLLSKNVTLSWNVGTQVLSFHRRRLSYESTLVGLSRRQVGALSALLVRVAAEGDSMFLLVGHKRANVGVVLDVMLCTSLVLVNQEAELYSSFALQKWSADALTDATTNKVVTSMSLVADDAVSADTLSCFLWEVGMPALKTVESGLTVDAPGSVTLMLDLDGEAHPTLDLAAVVRANKRPAPRAPPPPSGPYTRPAAGPPPLPSVPTAENCVPVGVTP